MEGLTCEERSYVWVQLVCLLHGCLDQLCYTEQLRTAKAHCDVSRITEYSAHKYSLSAAELPPSRHLGACVLFIKDELSDELNQRKRPAAVGCLLLQTLNHAPRLPETTESLNNAHRET